MQTINKRMKKRHLQLVTEQTQEALAAAQAPIDQGYAQLIMIGANAIANLVRLKKGYTPDLNALNMIGGVARDNAIEYAKCVVDAIHAQMSAAEGEGEASDPARTDPWVRRCGACGAGVLSVDQDKSVGTTTVDYECGAADLFFDFATPKEQRRVRKECRVVKGEETGE